MQTIKVLLAEDDENLGRIVKSYLTEKGYNVHWAMNGEEAITNFLAEKDFDICLLDIMMPIKDGFVTAKEIRGVDKEVPIIFLTAKNQETSVAHGFDLGADDYMTKPFNFSELILRMSAVLRRYKPDKISDEKVETFVIGKCKFDYTRQILQIDKTNYKLTSKESELLKMLCERKNEVLDRSLALNKIWIEDNYFNARSMDVYITKLRKYLKEDPTIELINVHSVGFKLVEKNKD